MVVTVMTVPSLAPSAGRASYEARTVSLRLGASRYSQRGGDKGSGFDSFVCLRNSLWRVDTARRCCTHSYRFKGSMNGKVTQWTLGPCRLMRTVSAMSG